MASAKDIRFDQRNVTNTAYQEKYVNGNSLILRTDSTGSVVGASTLEGVAIGTTTPSTANFTNVTASVISSSILIGNLSGSLSGSNIIANNISSSTLYVSQNIINDGTLTVVGNSTLSNVTASNISASGNISSSNLFVSNNTTLGNDVNDLILTCHSNLLVAQKDKEKSEESIAKLKELTQQYKFYEYYLMAVNRDGVPYDLITTAVPFIEQEINNILTQLVDFNISNGIADDDEAAVDTYDLASGTPKLNDDDVYWNIEHWFNVYQIIYIY